MIDYDELKMFYRVVVPEVFNPRFIEGDANPVQVLDRVEQSSPSLARRALRIGISDAMTKLNDVSPDALVSLSSKLAEAGSPSIAMIRAYLSKKWVAIVKHGSIETDEQFYLVRELVDDPSLTSKDCEKLALMLENYEARR